MRNYYSVVVSDDAADRWLNIFTGDELSATDSSEQKRLIDELVFANFLVAPLAPCLEARGESAFFS
jgi:hypothetical protein